MTINFAILLVEDNKDDEELIILAFREAHIQNKIDIVRDGAEALDYLFQRKQYKEIELPQLVFLDLKLPKVNGLEILKQIRSNPRTKYLPVVIFTSSIDEQDLIDSYKLGINSYIQKPVGFEKFSKAVSCLGLYWVVMNQYPSNWTQVVPLENTDEKVNQST